MLKNRKSRTNSKNKNKSEISEDNNASSNNSSQGTQISPEDVPPPRTSPWKHVIRRMFIIGLAFVAAYFTASRRDDGMAAFVQSKETISRRSFEVPCSQDYTKEKELWPKCVPRRCGRLVMDNLISPEDALAMLKIARKGFAFGGSSGGASILDLHSGALSKDDKFINIYMLPQSKGLFTLDDLKVYRRVRNAIQMRIMAEFGGVTDHVYLTHPTFFSRMTDKPPKTIHDEYWHPHIDKETYGTFHYTSLLYLNTYEEDFTGGRFVFVDKGLNMTVEPKRGRISLFTSGSENLHYVEKVTSGERFAVTVSFTCNSTAAIPDPAFGL